MSLALISHHFFRQSVSIAALYVTRVRLPLRTCVHQALVLVVTAFLLTTCAWPAPAQNLQGSNEGSFREDLVLVAFRPHTNREQQAKALKDAGAVELRIIGQAVHVLKVPQGKVMEVIQFLRMSQVVRYAEPDFRHSLNGGPNDPDFPQQWAFQNTGQTVNGVAGTSGADEGAFRAWNITHGSASVVVAVADTGVDYNHPDLAPNVWSNPGGINGCAAGTHGFNVLTGICDPMDDDTVFGGHGTHVAGIIGAATNNGTGVAGVNWQTSLMGLKWVDANGNGFTSDLIAALDWVIRAKQAGVNVRIVNDSETFPGTAPSQALSDEIDALGANDILFVTAAGNTAQDNDTMPRYPCVYDRPNQICVAASDQNDSLWSSSNFGVQTVDLAAPGANILSTLRNSTYGFVSGTSMSAAQVSGAAALVLSTGHQPVTKLKATLLNSVDLLPAFSGTTHTGGRLDIFTALAGDPLSIDPASNSTVTVAAGNSANYSFQVNLGTNPPAGPATFKVAGLPPNSTASFTPSSLAQTGMMTMTVNTSGNGHVAARRPPSSSWPERIYAEMLLPILGLLAVSMRVRQGRKWLWLGIASCGLGLAVSFAGCGGSSETSPPSPTPRPTPAPTPTPAATPTPTPTPSPTATPSPTPSPTPTPTATPSPTPTPTPSPTPTPTPSPTPTPTPTPSPTPAPKTPPGTYTLTVTATGANGAAASTPVTLGVQ
jgi:subtilisin family serine protease